MAEFDPTSTALMLIDMQNDFLHPEGAYGRAGQKSDAIAALPDRLARVADAMRAAGGWVVSTHFTLVPGKSRRAVYFSASETTAPVFGQRGFSARGAIGHQLIDLFATGGPDG